MEYNCTTVQLIVSAAYKLTETDLLWEKNTVPIRQADKLSEQVQRDDFRLPAFRTVEHAGQRVIWSTPESGLPLQEFINRW
jgi:hypothetical protein